MEMILHKEQKKKKVPWSEDIQPSFPGSIFPLGPLKEDGGSN